jgi:hypothetical protein
MLTVALLLLGLKVDFAEAEFRYKVNFVVKLLREISNKART